jgi:tetratricopeptide (TPR) repeat protein
LEAGGELRVWESFASNQVISLPVGGRAQVAFAPSGQWLAAGAERDWRLWRTGTWKEELKMQRGAAVGRPAALAFSPDSQTLAVAQADGAVDLVEVLTGAKLATFEPPRREPAVALRFSGDGTRLICGVENSILWVWDLWLIRRELAGMGLDWPARPLPPRANDGQAATLELKLGGELGSQQIVRVKRAADSRRWTQDRAAEINRPTQDRAAEIDRPAQDRVAETNRLTQDRQEPVAEINRLTQELNQNPDDAKRLHRRAELYMRLADYAKAAEDWSHFLSLAKEGWALRDLAWIHIWGPEEVQDFAAARREATEAVQLEPSNPDNHYRLGAACARCGDFAAALTNLNQAEALLKPDDSRKARILMLEASCLFRLDRREEAVVRREQALQRLSRQSTGQNTQIEWQQIEKEAKSVFGK